MKGIRHYIKTIKNLLQIHGFAKDGFFTYHYRPKYADEVVAFEQESVPEVGIVIQGPLRLEDDFTFETIKLYKKYYPKTPLIVSTWDTEDSLNLKRLEDLCGAENVCISHFDKTQGNFQRTTALAGIARAVEMECKYIFKTRTDQRIYAPGILSFLEQMITDFPLKIQCAAKGRILCNGMGTFSNRLYDMSDMFVFGFTEDIIRYFSCPEDKRKTVESSHVQYHNWLQYQTEISKLRVGEMWYSTHYIESLGYDLKWTMEDSDYYRKELYIVVDDAMIDLYWPKYTNKEYRWRNYNEREFYHQATFREWYMERYEE